MILRPYKRIKELEEIIDELKRDYRALKEKEEERLRKKREGLHDLNALCTGCIHSITEPYGYPYACKLDCKCEDREEHNGLQTGNV